MRRGRSRWTTRHACALLVAGLALAMSGCGSASGGDDQGDKQYVIGSWTRGFSVVLTDRVAETAAGDKQLKVINYSDLQQLYTDVLSGKADMTIGGPDVFASQAAKGAPIHIAATVSPNSTALVGKSEITSAADIKGKRIAAITTSGGWRITKALLADKFGVKEGKDFELVNVPNAESGVTQVAAGTADFAVGWEPAVTSAVRANPGMKVAFSSSGAKPGETFGTGWQLVLAVRDSVSKDAEQRAVTRLQEAAQWLNEHPDEADKYAAKQGFKPGTAANVMQQSVHAFVIKPVEGEIVTQLKEQLALIHRTGTDEKEPPARFYGVSN
ncbi:ABC transporter substrate-binding protein [Micromonospora sp. NPDC050200]|uniref:ABC transporter substrate-binding protein n=1 Tax=Micromonospora sp. NPDC050200 TaxID=3155664 RepID=UPI0033EB30C6